MKKYYIVFLLIIKLSCSVHAQTKSSQVVGSAGNSIAKSSVQITWTLGEVITNINKTKDTSVQLSQGFLHGNIQVTSIGEIIEPTVLLYPNPTSDMAIIELPNKGKSPVSYSLRDMQGRVLKTGKIITEKQEISFHEMPSAAYLIEIEYQKKLRIFKVIKN